MADVPVTESVEQPEEPPQQPAGKPDPQSMTFIEHLVELRQRLGRAVLFIILGSAVCWIFAGDIYDWLLQPLCRAMPDNCVVYPREMLEAFLVYVKTGLLAGFFVSSPFWMHQMWLFIAPGLFAHERRYATLFSLFGGALFIGGAIFGFFVVFPNAYKFMATLSEVPWLEYRLSMKTYARLTTTLALAFGVIFMTPLAVLFLSMMGVVTPKKLSHVRPYAVVIIFIAAAFLTPTVDPLTLLSMAIPMWILFEIGVLLARIQDWLKNRMGPKEGEETAADHEGLPF